MFKMTNQILIIIFLSIIITVTSCQSDYSKYEKVKETIGETDSNGLKQGTWTYYNSVGQILRIENFQDNALHGIAKSYYRNGNLYTKAKYNKGKQIDTLLIYYENGQLNSYSWRDSNGISQGTFKLFYDNGQIKQIGEFKNGKLWGEVIEFHANGDTLKVDSFHNDTIFN